MVYDPERIVTIGDLEKRGKTVRFGIKEKDRSRHIYVIGQTGTGKSTLLEMLAMQDIRNGTGLIFMDPHGQSVEALLHYVTREYLDNIIYFAPHHQERPIGLNIMEDIGYDKRHLVVSSLMASFEKIWGAGTWSDRMAYILQNTLLALIEYPGTTLLDVGRMYSSKGFREKVVANLKDPQVRKYWVEEFANYTERYAQEATPSIQNKLGQFTSNPLMRNIIGQKESAFNFREIMDEGKILLVNLSKGQIGENNARMLGVLFTTKIYLAALSRSDMTKPELEVANPCNFFVDEFQSFANSSFSDILSEARKYKLNLVMAHQYLGQLYSDDSGGGDVIRDAVFGNVGTFISFRVGPVDAEIISKQFAPNIMEEDLVALPRYHIYLTLNIDGAGSTPFSARTFYESAPEGVSLEDEVVQRTMDVYGADRAVVEKMVEDNLAEDAHSNEALKKSSGQKGGGKKSGWQQGGGQRNGGQRVGGQKDVRAGDRRDVETHTPLKGLLEQVKQKSGRAKEKKSKEQEDDNEKVAKNSSDTSDQMNVEQPKKQIGHSGEDVKQKVNRLEGRRSVSEEGVKKEVGVLSKPKVEKLQEHAEQGGEVGKVMNKGTDVLANAVQDKERRQERQKSDSVDTSKVQRASPERYRKRRGQRSGDVFVEREQGDSKKRSVSNDRVRHRERRDVVQSVDQKRGQRKLGRRDVRREDGDAFQGEGRRQERQKSDSVDTSKVQRSSSDRRRKRRERNEEKQGSRGEGDVQKQIVTEKKSATRTVKGKSKSVERQGVVTEVKQSKERAERQVKDEQLQFTDALRRPNGIVGGTVSRSMMAKQFAVEQHTDQSDALNRQQDAQQGQTGKQQYDSDGRLGDLVKATKANGLRKDLKVAPKKEKYAPPVGHEEGWIAIGDLTKG